MDWGIPRKFFTAWYCAHGRALPWREKGVTLFQLLVAEMLLRQTRAEMVAKVWPALVQKYPRPGALSRANPDELRSLVSGLGFGKQRTNALLELAMSVDAIGETPSRVEALTSLPHVGLYAAHAVACFGFGQRVPVVDLNVVRVISRIAGLAPPSDIRRAREVWGIAWALLPRRSFVEHNYGILDFASAVCKPRNPRCQECPLSEHCVYFRNVASRGYVAGSSRNGADGRGRLRGVPQ